MARPILGTPQAAKVSISGATPTLTSRSTLQGPRLQQRLREKRSTKYVQAITRLDAGTHHADRTALESLLEAISNEFPELGIEQLPVGIVSQCYLGAPYEVHICDLKGGSSSILRPFGRCRPCSSGAVPYRCIRPTSLLKFIRIHYAPSHWTARFQ